MLAINFITGKARHRRLYGGGKQQLIAKACGIKGKTLPTIFDVTAGLGQDAFVLACLGAKVTMIERNPTVAALLQQGLAQLKQIEPSIDLQLQIGDAMAILNTLTPEQFPDVIYLDPMHPPRNKSALVKKEMRVLREIVGDDVDKAQLFAAARSKAHKRVVVKWPRHAPAISDIVPDIVYRGNSTRFEVYLNVLSKK